MTFGQSVSTCFGKYATFSGRASLSEYWFWFLFQLVVMGGIYAIAFASKSMVILGLYGLVALALLLPTLAVAVRRLHDIGKGGGWFFITLVPFIGSIWYLVLMCTGSQPFENRFGLNEDQMRNQQMNHNVTPGV